MKQTTMLKAAATVLGALGKGIEGFRHGDTMEGVRHGAGQGLGADVGMGLGAAGGVMAAGTVASLLARRKPAITQSLKIKQLIDILMAGHAGGVVGGIAGAPAGWYGARKLIGPASYE